MFDVGFWELGLIMVIALLVVGPERLPKLARTTGLWLGKARSVLRGVKAEIDREIAAEELKQQLARQAGSTGLHEIIEETGNLAAQGERLLKPEPPKPASAEPEPPAAHEPEPPAAPEQPELPAMDTPQGDRDHTSR